MLENRNIVIKTKILGVEGYFSDFMALFMHELFKAIQH